VAPVIETARLRLRGFTMADLEASAAMLADPEVMRHVGGRPFSREDSWRRLIGGGPGMWAMLGHGYWAVERRDDGSFLGQIGFADFKRDMTPSIEGKPEMGWMFLRAAQGEGYAHEAVAAGVAWADEHLAGRELVAIIDPGNDRSIRLAEKVGFSSREPARYKDDQILLLRRPPASPA
jgi:RimJ/RimL family protein N-acetyltransferase